MERTALPDAEYERAESAAVWGYKTTATFFDGPIFIKGAGKPFNVKSGIDWSKMAKLVDYAPGSTEEERKEFVRELKKAKVPVGNKDRFDELKGKSVPALEMIIVRMNKAVLPSPGMIKLPRVQREVHPAAVLRQTHPTGMMMT